MGNKLNNDAGGERERERESGREHNNIIMLNINICTHKKTNCYQIRFRL